jgi:dTDP-glucose 4,6-dehydratase
MKILCTGTAGFIGTNFLRRSNFLGKNHSFISLDKFTYPQTKYNWQVSYGKSDNFYVADIADKDILSKIFEMEKPEMVINFAAESHVDNSISSATPFIMSNVLGTQNLLDLSIKNDVKLFFYISTDEVYGQLGVSDDSWKEEAVLNPRNPYAASKLSGELLVKAAHQTHGLQYVITRSCNNFGMRQSSRNFIPKTIQHIFEGKKMPIYGKGEQVREWIHVEDHCDAIWKIIESSQYNTAYNISTGNEISNIELFNHIANIIGKGHDSIEFVADRPGHDFRYSCDSSKLRGLGWKPSSKFMKALESTVSWYDNNRWFFK